MEMPTVELSYGLGPDGVPKRASETKYTRSLPLTSNTPGPSTQANNSVNIDIVESAENEESEDDKADSAPIAGVSENATYVDVTRRVVKRTFRKADVFYSFNERDTVKKDWKRSTIVYQNRIRDCVVYTSKHGNEYWTWALPKDKGKGK
jgi:hypothetical protein